jgi:dipeptidyl aminopeptidase/acylaminoacyl peptidase
MPRILRAALLVSFAISFPVAADADQAASSRPVTIDDFGKLKALGKPELSADGRQAAYALEGRIYIVPVRGGEPRQVTSNGSSASEPRWSADGKYLYFLSDRTGTSQLWKLPVDSFGEAEQVTHLERGVDTLELSPDEGRLLLSYEDELREEEERKDEAGVARKKPWVITRMHFKEDAGEGYLTEWPSDHLYVYDIADQALAQVTTGRYTESDAQWSPDGTRLVFASNRSEDPDRAYQADIWTVRASASGDDVSLTRVTNDEQVKRSPKWSPDGRSIAFLAAENGVYAADRIAIMPAEGGDSRILTAELDRTVRSFEFSADGRWIYFDFANHGGQHVARVRLSDGRIERLIEGERSVSAFDFDEDGNVAARLAGMNDAADIWYGKGARLDRLTNVNADYFAERLTADREKVSYTLEDGTVVEAFVTKPLGFEAGRRYPAILKIHGGPVAQFTYGYDFASQFFAANGYIVVEPNPRGSTGRGQEFTNAIVETWGITELPDVVGAVDHVVELGYADPDRLFVTGYSYGGYMTNVLITQTDRFRAAASGAGHSLIPANFGHDIYQKWYSWELGYPWDNRELYDRLSPLLRVNRVVTPTIFLGGREDWNVPILNAELFYQALRHLGVDTQLIVYPDTHHGNWDPAFTKDYLERILAWFTHHDTPPKSGHPQNRDTHEIGSIK